MANLSNTATVKQGLEKDQVKPAGFGIFLVILFLFSGILDDKGKNPIGIPLLVESTLLFAFLVAVLLLVEQINSRRIIKVDFLLFSLIIFLAITSAAFAHFEFSQPLFWGLVEDRRLLSVFIYFPLAFVLRRRYGNLEGLIKALITVALIACVTSIYLRASGLLESENTPGILLRSETRIALGTFLVISAYFWAIGVLVLTKASPRTKLKWIVLAAVFAGVLISVVQTRKIIIVVALVSLVLFTSRKRSILGTLIVLLLAIFVWLNFQSELSTTDFVTRSVDTWMQLFDENYLTRSARAYTISQIFEELAGQNYLIGFGALSLLWNEGFHSVYGTHFYLADVGIIGVTFRLGVPLTIVYLLSCLYIAFISVKPVSDKLIRTFLIMGFWYIFLSPGAGILFYAGQMFGILLAVSEATKNRTAQ